MFSRYDIYVDTWSMYYYKDIEVLRNKLNIKNPKVLKEAEEEISFRKTFELTYMPVKGRFTMTHLCNIHKYIFEDIYAFAGKIRYEDISKGNTRFCSVPYIKENLQKIFLELKSDRYIKEYKDDKFFAKLSYYMAELNVIHPFREGNGRAIREFIRQLALVNGYIIDWSKVPRQQLLDASIASVYDTTDLVYCLSTCSSKDSNI